MATPLVPEALQSEDTKHQLVKHQNNVGVGTPRQETKVVKDLGKTRQGRRNYLDKHETWRKSRMILENDARDEKNVILHQCFVT